MSVYTLPRSTRDLDFIVHLKKENVESLLSHFRDGYYCNEDSVLDAIKTKRMFNIIDHKSNFKAGFVILKDSEFRLAVFSRRKKIDFLGISLYVVSGEDLLISKIIWIQELQSAT